MPTTAPAGLKSSATAPGQLTAHLGPIAQKLHRRAARFAAPPNPCDLTSMMHDVKISLQGRMSKLWRCGPNSGCKETKMLA